MVPASVAIMQTHDLLRHDGRRAVGGWWRRVRCTRRALLRRDELVEVLSERNLRAGNGSGGRTDDDVHRPRLEARVRSESGHHAELPRDTHHATATKDQSDAHDASLGDHEIIPRTEVRHMSPGTADDELESVIADSPARVVPIPRT